MHFNILPQTMACDFNDLQEVGISYEGEVSRVLSFFFQEQEMMDEFRVFIKVHRMVNRDP